MLSLLAPSSPKSRKICGLPCGHRGTRDGLSPLLFCGGGRNYEERDKPRHDAYDASDEDSF